MKPSYLVAGWPEDWTDPDGTIITPEELFYQPSSNVKNWAHEVIWLEANGASIADAIRIHDCLQEDFESMTLLIPDRDRDNQEDFIWALPVERQKFNKWYSLSEKFRGITPKEHGNIRYVNRVEGSEVKTVLVMPTSEHSDDDVVHACAFLRMVKGINCRMWVVRCSDDLPTTAQLINRVMGTDPKMVENIEDEDIEGQEEKPQHP